MGELRDNIIIKPDKEYAGCIKFFLRIIPIVVIVLVILNLYEGSAGYRWGARLLFVLAI